MGLNDPYVAEDRVLGRYSYLRKLNNDKDWFLIDCGSHKGKFAESLSNHVTLAKIIFIDINKEFNALLKEKFPNAKIMNGALTDKKGVFYLVRNSKNSGQNYASRDIKTKEKLKTLTLTEVFNLDAKKSNLNIFLKIDIEGNEISVLKSLPEDILAKISVVSIEILPSSDNLNYITCLNGFIPPTYEFYRERRYGLVKIQRNDPHWTDNLNLFQNLILINSQVS